MFCKLLLIFAIASIHHLGVSHGLGQRAIQRYLGATQQINRGSLKYGQNCSWEAEEARQNLTTAFFSESKESYLQKVNCFVEQGLETCSAAELMVCDRESLKCMCGDPDQEALQGIQRNLFIFQEYGATGSCRRNTNATCISTDVMLLFGFKIDSNACKSGTICKTRNGKVCSTSLAIRYLVRKFGYNVLSNPKRLKEELMSGRVCSCS